MCWGTLFLLDKQRTGQVKDFSLSLAFTFLPVWVTSGWCLELLLITYPPWQKGCWVAKPTPEPPTSRLHLCKANVSQNFCYLHPTYPFWDRCSSRSLLSEERWFAGHRTQMWQCKEEVPCFIFLAFCFHSSLKTSQIKNLMAIFYFSPGILP